MKGAIIMSEIEGNKLELANFPVENKTCPTISSQRMDVCIPVTIKPYANVDCVVVKCCGEAVVLPGHQHCIGKKDGACVFTISQTICVEVPVEFGAVVNVGDTFVDCLCAFSDENCEKCRPNFEEEVEEEV